MWTEFSVQMQPRAFSPVLEALCFASNRGILPHVCAHTAQAQHGLQQCTCSGSPTSPRCFVFVVVVCRAKPSFFGKWSMVNSMEAMANFPNLPCLACPKERQRQTKHNKRQDKKQWTGPCGPRTRSSFWPPTSSTFSTVFQYVAKMNTQRAAPHVKKEEELH